MDPNASSPLIGSKYSFNCEGLAVYVAGGHYKPEPLAGRGAALFDLGYYVTVTGFIPQHEQMTILKTINPVRWRRRFSARLEFPCRSSMRRFKPGWRGMSRGNNWTTCD